ncbi:hypothetical protein [Streptomyces sparsogenes]|uniref:Uncharacterized protein n=1 Tax=Streptomyces sparsogenes DSM 40356 TaxID=1331668 RepID=A0A1R1S570_9ACTN|nr:hypothetical protein [Streptomyces sparsogenes]OMI33418.1 hypothetical protein SPAR_41544 [Streptomyces sparsogenes DSM 40356]
MDVTSHRDLAEGLKSYGLSITAKRAHLYVANTLSASLAEEIFSQGGRCTTAWGYEIGERGDEIGTAHRLAYLLGAPPGVTA